MTNGQKNAELLESVIDGLTHLLVGTDERSDMAYPKSSVRNYDGFELLDERLWDEDDFILLGRDPSDMPIWPIDVRWGYRHEQGWMFKKVNTLDYKNWRGRLSFCLPKMCELHESYITSNGSLVGSVGPFGLTRRGVVDALAHNHPLGDVTTPMARIYGRKSDNGNKNYDVELNDISVAQGMSLRREYLWSVLLGEESVPRARFVTDPIGVREAFRLRDIPPGKSRRAALRHWVTEHWRKRRDPSAEDMIFVREYLRGSTSFKWNGLGCLVEPSREDLRRALRKTA